MNKVLSINYSKIINDLKNTNSKFVDKDFPQTKSMRNEELKSIRQIYKNL